ncbi:MAG: hypothetical protein IJV22_05895 [Bacteroidales bacterium]|nr:hypothetical protein [Bacteroidales bacterium]
MLWRIYAVRHEGLRPTTWCALSYGIATAFVQQRSTSRERHAPTDEVVSCKNCRIFALLKQ